MNSNQIIKDLEELEGFKPYAYRDSLGIWTIGYGINVDKDHGGGITEEESEMLLLNRLNTKIEELDTAISWWRMLDDVRQDVIVEMAYQLGVQGLLDFNKFLAYAKAKQYDLAAGEMLNSLWAQQTPERAKMLSQRFATGKVE